MPVLQACGLISIHRHVAEPHHVTLCRQIEIAKPPLVSQMAYDRARQIITALQRGTKSAAGRCTLRKVSWWGWRMKRLASIFIVIATGVAGCSSSTGSGIAHTWVAGSESDAVLLQLTENGKLVSGTIDATELQSPSATRAQPEHAAFTGTLDGTALTLTFAEGFGFATSLAGTLGGSTLSLQIPQSDGSMTPIDLHPGTVSDYNQDVAALQGTASSNAQAATAAAEQSAAAAATQAAEQKIDSAGSQVASDMSNINQALSSPPDFSSFDNAINQAKNGLATAQQDVARAANESDQSTACGDADSAQGDADSVQGDADSLQGDVDGFTPTTSNLTSLVGTLDSDERSYQGAAAELPSYSSPDAPATADIQAIKGKVAATTSSWQQKIVSYQSVMKQLVDQANNVAQQAQTKYCG